MTYSANRIAADRLIARKGQVVTLAGQTGGTYDPATGTSTGTPTSKTGKAVILPLAGYRKIGEGNIVQGDETMLLSGLDSAGAALTEPKVNTIVTLADGSKRTLVVVDPLRPDGLEIIYDCVVRGSA